MNAAGNWLRLKIRWVSQILRTEVITEVRALFGAERFAFTVPLDGGLMFFAILRDDEHPDARPGPADPDHVLAIYHASFGASTRTWSRACGA